MTGDRAEEVLHLRWHLWGSGKAAVKCENADKQLRMRQATRSRR